MKMRAGFRIIEDGTDNSLRYPQVELRKPSYKVKGTQTLWRGKEQVGTIQQDSATLDITRLRVSRPFVIGKQIGDKNLIRILAMLGPTDPYLLNRCLELLLTNEEARELANDILARLAK